MAFIFPLLDSITANPIPSYTLRRRHHIKRLRNLLLPLHFILAVNLRPDPEILSALREQCRPRNDGIRTHNFLVVVDVGGAFRAVVAVDTLSAVAVVSVLGGLAALSNLEGGFGDDFLEWS